MKRFRIVTILCATAAFSTTATATAESPPAEGITRLEQLRRNLNDEAAQRMAQLRDRHYTTTTAMSSLFAHQQNITLGNWLQTYGADLLASVDSDIDLSALTSLSSGIDPARLDGFLHQQGFTTALPDTVSTDPLGEAVAANMSGLMREMATLRAPQLPDSPSFNTMTLSATTLVERAGSLLAVHAPADYETLVKGLTTTPASWPTALQNASTAMNDSNLLTPCQRAMIAAMGSGRSGDSAALDPSCTSCVAQGVYLHEQITRPSGAAQTLPPAEFNRLPSWRRQAIMANNPQLLQPAANSATTQGSCTPARDTQRQVIASTTSRLRR